jgi:hypothetical protein
MKHIQNFESYNESIKDYLVAGALAASTALSSPKEVKATEKEKMEYTKAKDVKVELTSVDTISYDIGFDGIYDIRHSENIEGIIIHNSGDKQNRKRGEVPQTDIIGAENTVTLILKTTVKNNEHPIDFKLIPKSQNNNTAWGTPDNFTKVYLIPLEFETDIENTKSEYFLKFTISNLRKGSYSFNISGSTIKFEVK